MATLALFPGRTDQLGISEEAIGLVISTFLFAYMVCMTPGGWLIDRFGPKLALVVMGFGSALFGALTGLAGISPVVAAGLVLPVFFVVRFLMGIFTAPLYPACGRAVSFWIPQGQRTVANGLVQAGAAVGIACAFPLFGYLIDTFDWPTAFMVTGSFTALLAICWTLYATDHPVQHCGANQAERQLIGTDTQDLQPGHSSTNWRQLFGNRSLVLLTINYAAVGYIEYLFFFWMQYYFKDVLHLGKQESRVYSTILNLALAVGMVLGGWLTDRFQSIWGHGKGRALMPILGMIAGALFLWLGLMVEDKTMIVTCLAIALGSVGACEATVWTTAVELGGRQGGTAAAIVNTGGNLGGLIAPVLTPVVSTFVIVQLGVSKLESWQWAIGLGSVICLLGAILWLWIDPNER